MMQFDAVPMEEVVETLNRHTERPLIIANDSIRGLSISGRFRVGDTEGFQFLLRERFGVTVEAEQNRIVLR